VDIKAFVAAENPVAEKMNHEPNIYGTEGDARKGAAAYTPLALALYDLAVLRFSNSFVWKCTSRMLLDFYNEHISDTHLDIGVGTGYFLDKCRFPSTAPKIALFDLNPNSLAKSARRLCRYNPSCYMGNALQRIDICMSGFDSISLNYLLHCLPGNLASKSIVFEHVKPLLRDGGVIFGSTILGEGVGHNPLAKQLIKIYNARGIFSNLSDRQSDLEAGLKAHFDEHTIQIAGCVALFSARKRMARTVAAGQKGLGESRHLQH
jgi:SAM-dependent methyltransferase